MDIDELTKSPSPDRRETDPTILGMIQDLLSRLRFGSIQLTVHEGKLVQIDVTEKTRLSA